MAGRHTDRVGFDAITRSTGPTRTDVRPRTPCRALLSDDEVTEATINRGHRYLAAAEFRYNTRNVDDGERVKRAIQGADGKRLTYRPVTG